MYNRQIHDLSFQLIVSPKQLLKAWNTIVQISERAFDKKVWGELVQEVG